MRSILPGSAALAVLLAQAALAEETPGFGGPDSVERIIETDRSEKGSFIETEIFKPLESWQDRMESDYGFSIGGDYSIVTLGASDVLDGAKDNASSGMLRVYGRWNLTDGEGSSGALAAASNRQASKTGSPQFRRSATGTSETDAQSSIVSAML